MVEEWKERARVFRWTCDQIAEEMEQSMDYVDAARRLLHEGEKLLAAVASRRAITHLARACLMRRNNPRHLDPRDVTEELRTSDRKLYDAFVRIQFGVKKPPMEEIESLLGELESYGTPVREGKEDSRFRRSFRDFDMHMGSVREGLWRGHVMRAALHLRRAAHLLVEVIVEEQTREQDYLERIRTVKDIDGYMYNLYSRIEQAGDLGTEEIQTSIEKLDVLINKKDTLTHA